MNAIPVPTDMCIIITYRCPMQCQMYNIWQNLIRKEKEITLAEIKKLPSVKFINITGGEPFVREDLEEIIEVCFQKSPRVVISTSRWFEERIIKLANKFWKESMGNIRQASSFGEIWHSEQAEKIRQQVLNCPKHCWMVRTASPVMKKYIHKPLSWVLRDKWNTMTGKPISIELKQK